MTIGDVKYLIGELDGIVSFLDAKLKAEGNFRADDDIPIPGSLLKTICRASGQASEIIKSIEFKP